VHCSFLTSTSRVTLCLPVLLSLGVVACAGVKSGQGHLGVAGSSGAAGAAGSAVDAGGAGEDAGADAAADAPPLEGCQGKCMDFPAAPLIDLGVSPDAPGMFAVGLVGAGPCITEPEDGALFPNNWLRPRVKFTPAVPGTLHEIRFHSDEELNDLVAYTTNDHWTMPKAVWTGLASHVRDSAITVTVRAVGGGTSMVSFTIAPVAASGSVVFWAANPADHGNANPLSSSLQGFAVGDESSVQVLGVRDVQMSTRNADNSLRPVTCIGCHNSTPDGKSVGFIDNFPWNMAIAGVEPTRPGLKPPYLTPGGVDTIRQPGMGIFSFSKAHWIDGDRIAVSPYYLDMPCGQYKQTNSNVRLAWLDVEAGPVTGACPIEGKQFGIIARNGDTSGAANPTWSHDGKTIVYSSTSAGQDGRLGTGPSDLFTVPYNDRAGGAATPLQGAADPNAEEYYPSFSFDDALVAFDRVPAGEVMYANPLAELYVVPSTGAAEAKRLPANDPPTCSGRASPGVNNHWAKWAPGVGVVGSKKYYWLIFSSNRYGTPPVVANDKSVVQVSQLYATAIVVDGTQTQMFPAIYLWNQSTATLNTTPAWDPFSIPIVQ